MKNVIGRLLGLSLALLVLQTASRVYAANGTFTPTLCDGGTGLLTGIGCIPTTTTGFASILIKLSLGIGGGIAFLLIILGGMTIQTSAGNPERMNQGREIIEGAVIGLLLIILSIFILHVVGVDILAIPGFK